MKTYKFLSKIGFFLGLVVVLNCGIVSAQTQSEMNEEAYNSFQKSDKELNEVYTKIISEYKSDTIFINNLIASQKLWIKFRDAELKMKYPDRGPIFYGSIHPLCVSIYLEQITKDRIKTLKIWLEGSLENDACNGSVKIKEDLLYKIIRGKYDEVGAETGYVNSKGDTVITLGKYYYCYTDTLKNFAIVITKQGKLIGIDRYENELYEVYFYDNGPDYISDGLFRIIKDGKIGYADSNGQIIIEPQYDCANPFENGQAKVSVDCKTVPDGEHSFWISDKWFYIDKTGKSVLKK